MTQANEGTNKTTLPVGYRIVLVSKKNPTKPPIEICIGPKPPSYDIYPIRELNDAINNIVENKRVSPAEVFLIVLKTRQLLEVKDLKPKYKLLNFYCDWFVHCRMSLRDQIYDHLYQISERMREALNEPGDGKAELAHTIGDEANGLIHYPSFRQELKNLFTATGVNTALCTSKTYWYQFTDVLLNQLFDKPISFPKAIIAGASTGKGHAINTFNKIQNQPVLLGTNLLRINSMILTPHEYKLYLFFISDGPAMIRWPFQYLEQDTVFDTQ